MFLEAFVFITSTHFILSQPSVSSVCFKEPNTGSCRALIPSFYFNAKTGFCDCYVYGGCQSGGNNFNSMAKCMETCGSNKAPQVISIECQKIFANTNIGIPAEASNQIGGQSAQGIVHPSGGQKPTSPVQPFGQPQIPSLPPQLPGAIQTPQPLEPSQGSSPASQLPDGPLSISNKPPVLNQTTVQQVQTITTGIRPQPSNQQQSGQVTVQQEVPRTQEKERPGLPGSAASLAPQDKEQAKPFISASAQEFQRRQILKQQEIELQHQASIQQHLQLQQQQQRQQQEQLLQLQEKQRQQQLAG
ncbi:SWI/SNF chromatin-remodeling complex subunit SNF5 [Hyalella azteca]|nr:SWI/SNF chromatin-remodeling complex subunit SNF5 [Hyalella azteca]